MAVIVIIGPDYNPTTEQWRIEVITHHAHTARGSSVTRTRHGGRRRKLDGVLIVLRDDDALTAQCRRDQFR